MAGEADEDDRILPNTGTWVDDPGYWSPFASVDPLALSRRPPEAIHHRRDHPVLCA
ncbi:hypothetical protein B005_4354 [Nocardiopsis alba ATCC BAA-2165]|uniref:Uncharacterized protein n=1 Tax=Nocardiopsis alba (strain ATCC BAA-2165 / BE74) TaxID=1205910 RepID=J7L790_NOCAA|nr:hypothetical protein B005_4354 [Nocardiopsis alba ATCC BAA-2165]